MKQCPFCEHLCEDNEKICKCGYKLEEAEQRLITAKDKIKEILISFISRKYGVWRIHKKDINKLTDDIDKVYQR